MKDKDLKPGFPIWDRPAPECDDQLPLFSTVGRGLQGDGYMVRIRRDSDCETYLEGMKYDAASGTYSSDWVSQNINGGKMMYQYNLRPYTNPQTFTITFRVKRPNRPEWQWTTPAIPYIWDADNDGHADVDGIVGCGVSTLFIKKTGDAWIKDNLPTYHSYTVNGQEKLIYPNDWTREMFNAPKPEDPWTVGLSYGIGGDIDAPNIDDLAKILGITVQNIRNIIADAPGQFNGSDNVRDYVDDAKAHIHADMGFGSSASDSQFPGDGGSGSGGKWKHPIQVTRDTTGGETTSTATTVKGYIDEGDSILRNRIKNLEAEVTTLKTNLDTANDYIKNLYGLIEAIVGKMPGVSLNTSGTGASRNPNKNTNIAGFPNNGGIAVGDINLYSGSEEAHGIYTHTGSSRNNDIKAV